MYVNPQGVSRYVVIYCGFLLSVSAFSIDITLPFFSQIGADLGVTTSRVSGTVTVYIGFMGLGQLFFGSFSDRFGRKPALVVGLSLFLLGAVLSLIAQSFTLLLFARAMQGLGGAAAPVVARAILRDLFTGRELARAMAVATGIFSVGPIIGPLLGGAIFWFGGSWRIVFLGMVLYVAVLLLVLWRLPETLSTRQPDALRPAVLWRNTLAVTRNRQSRFFIWVGMITLTAMVLIVSQSQPVFAAEFGITGLLFALLFATHGTGIIIGQFLNHRLIGRIGEVRTAIAAATVTLLATLLITVFAVMHWLSAFSLTFFIFIFAIGFLAVASNSISLTLEPHGNIAGFASSFQGGVSQIGAGALATLVSWSIPIQASSWGAALLLISIIVLASLWTWQRRV